MRQGSRHVVNDRRMSAADPNDGDNWFNRFFSGQSGKQSQRKRVPDTSELSPETQTHLRRVYTNLGLTSLSASIASYAYLNRMLPNPGFLLAILVVGTVLGIRLLPNVPRNQMVRSGLLYGFGFANGWGLGPLVREVMWLDPSIIFSALSGSAVIFLSLTVTAMMTPRRSQLYLGGLLAAATSGLLWLSLINGFAHSASLFNAEIYIGLLVFAGYVLFDTQLIVENSEEGRRDTVGDALELFTNLFAIFVRILVLLSQDRQRKRRRTKDDDD